MTSCPLNQLLVGFRFVHHQTTHMERQRAQKMCGGRRIRVLLASSWSAICGQCGVFIIIVDVVVGYLYNWRQESTRKNAPNRIPTTLAWASTNERDCVIMARRLVCVFIFGKLVLLLGRLNVENVYVCDCIWLTLLGTFTHEQRNYKVWNSQR